MSKTPNFDVKIKAILDATTPGERTCPISGDKWLLDQGYIDRCRRWNVPPSEFSPFMRMKILASGGAGVDLWWKPHAVTGKPILSTSHPDTITPVVTDQEFYSEDFALQHTVTADPAIPFFSQLEQLMRKVPLPALYSHGSENCVGGGFIDSVNCYMVFGNFGEKDAWYSFRNRHTDRCLDTAYLEHAENTFSAVMSVRLNRCVQALGSLDCLSCTFVFDARNCEFCFCSTNLRHRKYVFMNEQLTREEYERRMSTIDLSCQSAFNKYRQAFQRILREQTVWPEDFNVNATDCHGDYLLNCLRSDGWYMTDATDVRDGWFIFQSENLEDVVISRGSSASYFSCCVAMASQNVKFSFVTDQCASVEYCYNVANCESCFGCVGLRRKKFHIFNKPYDESEYWKMVDAIKTAMLERGEYGRFFPPKLMEWWPQYGFASLITPFTDEELTRIDAPEFDPKAGMRFAPYRQDIQPADPAQVPDCIKDVGDEWVGVQFDDAEQGRRWSVNKQEIEYRKAQGYPFPRQHYRGRLIELMRQVNNPRRETRTCGHCAKMIEINVNLMFPNRTVYCRPCYLKFIEERN